MVGLVSEWVGDSCHAVCTPESNIPQVGGAAQVA